MSSTGLEDTNGSAGLRERLPNDPSKPQQASSVESAKTAVKAMNDKEDATGKSEEEKRTYGRTPDGTGALHTSRQPASSTAVGQKGTLSLKLGPTTCFPGICKLILSMCSLHRPANS